MLEVRSLCVRQLPCVMRHCLRAPCLHQVNNDDHVALRPAALFPGV